MQRILLSIHSFVLLWLISFAAVPSMAQMKSVDFPDTIRFEPLTVISKGKKMPKVLPANEFDVNTLVFGESPTLENEGRQLEFRFWMLVGKRQWKFSLNSRLQFNDYVMVSVMEVPIGGLSYYQIEFLGYSNPEASLTEGGSECGTFYWVDPRRMQVLDFTKYRNEWWMEGETVEGEAMQSSAREEAMIAVEDSAITISLERERFTPEPNYHLFLQTFTYTYRQDAVGWIKTGESQE